MYWSEKAHERYEVTLSAGGLELRQWKRRRVLQRRDFVSWYQYEFHVDRTYYMDPLTFSCDPQFCPYAYYLGTCKHERILRNLLQAWESLRRDMFQYLLLKLRRLLHDLIRLKEALPLILDSLPTRQRCRLVRGVYLFFHPNFLKRLSPRQLLLILNDINFPMELTFTDVDTLIERLCAFQRRLRPLGRF